MSSIKSNSVGKQTLPIGAPDERMRPSCACGWRDRPVFTRSEPYSGYSRKMHAALLIRDGRRRGIASYRN
jgi:hypothetical protein